jgi:hypothetical protein
MPQIFTTYDVILQTTGTFDYSFADFDRQPEMPVEANFFLRPDVWIGRLPVGVKSSQVMDACEPAGHNHRPTRQYGVHYGFIRTLDQTSYPSYTWDEDRALSIILFLSRLIHPTTISGHYSARLILEDGVLNTIVPGHVQGFGTHVWLVANSWRDYLTHDEAAQLKQAIPLYRTNAPERVRRARGHIDHAFHSYYLDQKIASLVSAFESLLKVERHGATRQFKIRSQNLGSMFGETISLQDADKFYDDRSSYVHGSGLEYTDLDTDVIDRFQLFERTLRAALLRASIDPTFAQIFEDDTAIVKAFGS